MGLISVLVSMGLRVLTVKKTSEPDHASPKWRTIIVSINSRSCTVLKHFVVIPLAELGDHLARSVLSKRPNAAEVSCHQAATI